MAFTGRFPQYMLSDRLNPAPASNDQDTNMLQIPQSKPKMRRFSSASSLATVESVAETTSSMESLSIATSISSLESSKHLSDQASQDLIQERFGSTEFFYKSKSDHDQTALKVRKACHYSCHCACHQSDNTNARKGVAMFKTKSRCTDTACRNNDHHGTKQSLSFRNALSQALSTRSIEIRCNLNTYRMVPEGSDAMRHIKHGDLDKLKACIDAGEATIWDTAPDGWSLLHV